MFPERILFATDFPEPSASAPGSVIPLRTAGCKAVILVHLLDTRETGEVLAEPPGGMNPGGSTGGRLPAGY